MSLNLVVLAAGMGSRYGGLKQLDGVGPSGETIMDYSVFDALRAGFDRIIFVIRRDIEKQFRETVASRYEGRVNMDFAFQDLNDLPAGFSVPEDRVKPWGTAHALYAARKLIDGPFAVINADDFYGRDSYEKIAEYLRGQTVKSDKVRGCIAAFTLRNTLSENGSVARGICGGKNGNLSTVTEHTKIFLRDGKIFSQEPDNSELSFTGDELVSMNSWGFMPEFVDELEALFIEFLREHGGEIKSEFYLPGTVDTLIKRDKAEIKLLHSGDSWFGVTYQADRPVVCAELRKMAESGKYPEPLYR